MSNEAKDVLRKKILVLNSGSSSLKSKLYDIYQKKFLCDCVIDRIGQEYSYFVFNSKKIKTKPVKDHGSALRNILDNLIKKSIILSYKEIVGVGHRVVHGGEFFSSSVVITKDVINKIRKCNNLAPLHNPNNLKGIEVCKKLLPHSLQVAVFDTSFHHSIPEKAFRYAIPADFYKKYKIRRYGFHGTSYRYIVKKLKELDRSAKKIIICHLGNGASICAVNNGTSIDTSMGFTPLEGLVMGTRSGDLDPSLIPFLCKHEDLSSTEIDEMLNKMSGLKGLTGFSDMRDIYERSCKNKSSKTKFSLAIDIFSYRLKKYIGAYISVLGGVDAIVFTGGLGENAFYVREKTLSDFDFLGLKLDKRRNRNSSQLISATSSKVKVYVLKTDEELMIVEDTLKFLKN